MTTTLTRWNRCKPDCGCADVNHPNPAECACWPTSQGKCERDRRTNAQMRFYALAVACAMTGTTVEDGTFVCPLTGDRTDVGLGEVDKVDPSAGYVPGNVVMVSRLGNRERGIIQQRGTDILGADRYAADVRRASAGIPLYGVSQAYAARADVAAARDADERVRGLIRASDLRILRGPYSA